MFSRLRHFSIIPATVAALALTGPVAFALGSGSGGRADVICRSD